MMHLNVIYFSISVRPALSYAVEKVKSMLEVADVLKSSGKELLALVPKDSKFGDVSNKIQNAIYWVNASLKSLCPFNGHAAEVPVSDFDIPQFGTRNYMGNGKIPLFPVWQGIHTGNRSETTCKYIQEAHG